MRAHVISVCLVLAVLGVSIPAHACQLVCMVTNAKYKGNLGGLAGADAKCAAEFKGFKFARSPSVLANIGNGAGSSEAVLYGYHRTSTGATFQGTYREGIRPGISDPGSGTPPIGVGTINGATLLSGAWVHGPVNGSGSGNCNISGGGSVPEWTGADAFGVAMATDSQLHQCDDILPLLCCNM